MYCLFSAHTVRENTFISVSSMAITSLLTSDLRHSLTGKVQLGKNFSISLDSTVVIIVNTVQILEADFFVNRCSNSNKRGGAKQTVNTCIWWILVLK